MPYTPPLYPMPEPAHRGPEPLAGLFVSYSKIQELRLKYTPNCGRKTVSGRARSSKNAADGDQKGRIRLKKG